MRWKHFNLDTCARAASARTHWRGLRDMAVDVCERWASVCVRRSKYFVRMENHNDSIDRENLSFVLILLQNHKRTAHKNRVHSTVWMIVCTRKTITVKPSTLVCSCYVFPVVSPFQYRTHTRTVRETHNLITLWLLSNEGRIHTNEANTHKAESSHTIDILIPDIGLHSISIGIDRQTLPLIRCLREAHGEGKMEWMQRRRAWECNKVFCVTSFAFAVVEWKTFTRGGKPNQSFRQHEMRWCKFHAARVRLCRFLHSFNRSRAPPAVSQTFRISFSWPNQRSAAIRMERK